MTAVSLVKESLEKHAKGDQSALYKLVLLDYSMPLMDGPHTSEAIFKLYADLPSEVPKPYVVCLTAFTEKAFEDKARASGMSEFISKPISNDHLKSLLSKNQLIDEIEEEIEA
jgi:CheY-like chemotaxis protein